MKLMIVNDNGQETDLSRKINETTNKAVIKAAEVTTKAAATTSKLLTVILGKSAQLTAKLSDKLDEEYRKINK